MMRGFTILIIKIFTTEDWGKWEMLLFLKQKDEIQHSNEDAVFLFYFLGNSTEGQGLCLNVSIFYAIAENFECQNFILVYNSKLTIWEHYLYNYMQKYLA